MRAAGPSIRLAREDLGAHAFWLWTAIAVLVAVALRAPWFGTPLGNDEAGLTYIADHWHSGGPNLYGAYFIDRPPLLLGVFRIAAETGGTAAVRTIGALTAGLVVVCVSLVGRKLGGLRTAWRAALIAAILLSAPALGSVMTPAELIACLPGTASILLLLVGLRRGEGSSSPKGSSWHFAAAGFLAVCAFMVKQSFGDPLLAGLVCLGALGLAEGVGRRRWLRVSGAYVGGVCLAVLGLGMFGAVMHAPGGSTAYALVGFRIDGLSALAGSAGGLPGRLSDRLLMPFFASGLVLVLVWGAVGLHGLRGRPVICATLGAWAVGGLAGVLLGGSYWPHYLIQLVPVASVIAASALAAPDRVGAKATAALLGALALAGLAVGVGTGQSAANESRAVGEYIRARSEPGDTIYVRYSQPNITYYSALTNPYPYHWSLMLRTFPDAQPRLRALLRSAHRPTWIAAWEPDGAYGLDADGLTARLVTEHYRLAGKVSGVPVLLERGLRRGGVGPSAG